MVSMSVIGTMIGSRFSPDLISFIATFLGICSWHVTLYIRGTCWQFFPLRKIGNYSKLDAYFAGLPGGIVDSIALAEQAGADVRIVTVQHFIRIILVVVTIPILFFIIEGNAVGSFAGETMASADYDWRDLTVLALVAVIGLFGGRRLKLPVAHLMAPLLLALILSVSGVIVLHVPSWCQHMAQYMIGVSLGSQFSGISRALLLRGLRMGFVSGIFMLCLAAFFASLTSELVPAGFEVMFISFAAGGLAEMSLIALSLNFSPIVVALHHLVRIFFTIWIEIICQNQCLSWCPNRDSAALQK